MTALSITKANVSWAGVGPVSADQIAGEAFDAGDMVYLKASDSKWYKAQDDGTAEEAGSEGIGMALGTADAANARVSIARPGAIVNLGTGTAGVVYCLGDTPGDLVPNADNGSGDKVTVVGLGIGSNKVQLAWVYNAGAVLA
ncbi:hypothetical protein [Reyranella sp.]|uniref:hypothetical protein n=1 Tax=Reyranella sp. TaxID=1929291 RepID=UPI003C7B332C